MRSARICATGGRKKVQVQDIGESRAATSPGRAHSADDVASDTVTCSRTTDAFEFLDGELDDLMDSQSKRYGWLLHDAACLRNLTQSHPRIRQGSSHCDGGGNSRNNNINARAARSLSKRGTRGWQCSRRLIHLGLFSTAVVGRSSVWLAGWAGQDLPLAAAAMLMYL